MTTMRPIFGVLAFSMLMVGFAPDAISYKIQDGNGSCPNGVTWADSDVPVSYYINKNTASGLSYSTVKGEIDKAFNAWESVCCADFAGNYQGKTSQTVTTGSSNNGSSKQVIDWEGGSWPSQLNGAAAVTLTAYRSCEYTHVDLLYNGDDYNWNTSGNLSSSSLDVRAVGTHEIGHVAGLGHSNNSNATMYARLTDINQQNLIQDDKNGVCYLYPKGETCNGKDDNCNGQVDEGNLTGTCPKSQGVCEKTTASCKNGSYNCEDAYGSKYEKDETTCDRQDNDCDGQVDEGITRECDKQKGVCESSVVECFRGALQDCDAEQYGEDYEASESSCDGKDNDCDGDVDEELKNTYWRDTDGDGLGNPDEMQNACPPGPDGFVDNDMDCAPSNPDLPDEEGSCEMDTDPDTGMADTGTMSDVGGSEDASMDGPESDASDDPGEGDASDDDNSNSEEPLIIKDDEPTGCGCSSDSGSPPLGGMWVLLVTGLLMIRVRRD